MNSSRHQTNEFLQDYCSLKQRMNDLQPKDSALELLFYIVMVGIVYTALGLGYFYQEELSCWLNPGTDTCVGCTDDCLEVGEPIKE